MYLLLIIILICVAIGALPNWPYASGYSYGYWPSGFMVVIVVILIVLLLSGRV